MSLKLIEQTGAPKSAQIIDVGGGASTLVDNLLDKDYENLAALDPSGAALEAAKRRLGTKAERIRWLEANILETTLPERAYDIWHDRAEFHFLTEPQERKAYVDAVLRSAKPGDHVIVATFAVEARKNAAACR